MSGLEINEESIKKMDNDNIKAIFDELKISKGIGKENKYSYSIITANKEFGFKGAFPKGELSNFSTSKEKYYKYLIVKGITTPNGMFLEGPEINAEDEIKKLNSVMDYSKYEACMGIDIETGEYYKINLIEQLHTMILGGTGSGKSVVLQFLLLQILQNPYSELYIIDKVDFQILEGTQKCRYRGIYENMTAQDFFAFKNYFLLEYARRQKIFKDLGVQNYDQYRMLMEKDSSLEKLNYIYILIDEFQSLRKRIANTIDVKVFDDNMKQLLDTVRSTGMCFYFGTQDYLKGQLGETRTAIRNFYLGKMDGCDLLKGDELKTVQKWIQETFLFYHPTTKKFLKIPYSHTTPNLLREYSNDPKNRIKDNTIYNSLPSMVNDVLDKTDSDIFSNIHNAFKMINISDEYIEKLKNTTEYIPFSILVYVILRDFELGLINGKNTDIFKTIDFTKPVDKVLWSENIVMYEKNKKLLSLLDTCFELGQNREEFIESLADVINNYLKAFLGTTKLTFGGDPESDNKEKLNSSNNNGKSLFNKQEAYEDPDLLMQVSYTGEIKPVSFNSMYYIDKLARDVRKSNEAIRYEKTIKDRITSKMIAKELRQVNTPVIVDIEFTLGIPVKINGELSKVGKNDLDNLLKATIDGLNNTIIKDDKQIYGIKTKIKYIEKQNNFFKNNNVSIKVYNLSKETFTRYKNIFSNEVPHTPEMTFNLMLGTKIEIPSVNNMYFIDDGKKKVTSNTINYKTLLGNYTKDYKNAGQVEITNKDVLVFLEFNINNSNNRDLDNMLKATIDAFQGIIIENDNQIREIMCFKSTLTESNIYNSRIKAQFFKYNPSKDIMTTDEGETQTILLEDGTFLDIPINNNDITKDIINDNDNFDYYNNTEYTNIGNQYIENNTSVSDDYSDNDNFDGDDMNNNVNFEVDSYSENNNYINPDNFNLNEINDNIDFEDDNYNENNNFYSDELNNNVNFENNNFNLDKINYNDDLEDVNYSDENNYIDLDIDSEINKSMGELNNPNNSIDNSYLSNSTTLDETIYTPDYNNYEDNTEPEQEEFNLFDEDEDDDDEFERKTTFDDDDFYDLSTENMKKQILD